MVPACVCVNDLLNVVSWSVVPAHTCLYVNVLCCVNTGYGGPHRPCVFINVVLCEHFRLVLVLMRV